MKKQCFFHERPSRKRTRTSKPTYIPSPFAFVFATDLLRRRVAQLEQKLDGLVTLLVSKETSSQMVPLGQVSGSFMPRSPVSLDTTASRTEPSISAPPSINLDREISGLKSLDCGIAPADFPSATTAGKSSVTSRGSSQFEPDELEAELLLLEYKTNLAEQFPFVVLHLNSTSQSLQHESPLLWKAIIVASLQRNSDRQMALGANLLEDVTMRLLLKAEKSLDLLQALLIFIAWY